MRIQDVIAPNFHLQETSSLPSSTPGSINLYAVSGAMHTIDASGNELVWGGTALYAMSAAYAESAAYAVSALYANTAGQVVLASAMWSDSFMGGLALRGVANAPTLTALTGSLLVYGFAGAGADEMLYGSMEMQHDYKEGTDIHPHVHWCPLANSTGDVVWQVEYATANANTAFGTAVTSIVTASVTASTLALTNYLTDLSAITGSGMKVGMLFTFRIFRSAGYAGDTFPGNAGLLQFGYHYETTGLGSLYELGNTS